jgi:glycosyltransferase involved in cell wall biosynthesis
LFESSAKSEPAISVILITPDEYQTIRKTIEHLLRQDIHDRMEIVIVAGSGQRFSPDLEQLGQFCCYRIVQLEKFDSVGAAYAAGIQIAGADVIALGEDHAFPQPGWASALLSAHRLDCAAVGPIVGNANPDNAISWADLYIAYSPWLEGIEGKTMAHLPGHNSSYKKSVLIDFGSRLPAMLEAETVLHWNLRSTGHKLWLEPQARMLHTNFSKLSKWISVQYSCGRQFAAARRENENWSIPRKWLFALASPLIPGVRLFRIFRELMRKGRSHLPSWSILPALILGLSLDAAGQMIGYLLGAGHATSNMIEMEFHRDRYRSKIPA